VTESAADGRPDTGPEAASESRGKKGPRGKKKAGKKKAKPRGTLGWREWLTLPDLGIDRIKAKVDTGARSSSLHAYDVRRFERKGTSWIRFKVHPIQDDSRTTVEAEAPLVEMRKVRSSSGVQTLRPVIHTQVELGGDRWEIELTLVRRDMMGFRMLLGRQAVRRRYLVDPGRSFLAGR
jgi:hypothetical protein